MGVAFLAPYFLAAFPIFAAIAWASYRARGKGTRVRIASVRLLKNFTRTPRSPDKPKVPLRYLMEILCALFLAALAAGLHFGKNAGRALILVDRSLSTEQRIGEDKTIKNILAEQANDFFDELDFSTVVDVIDTKTRKLLSDQNEGQLKEILMQNLTPHVDALGELLRDIDISKYDTIFVASDRPVQIMGTTAVIRQATLPLHPPRNIYFDGTTLKNIGSESVHGALTLSSRRDGEGKKNIPVEVPADGAFSFAALLSGMQNEIDARFTPNLWSDDQIAADSESKLQNASNDKQEIGVEGLQSLAGLGTENLSKFSWKIGTTEGTEKYAVIFEDGSKDAGTVGDLLSPHAIRQQISENKVNGAFSSWQDTSPLLRYLSPELIKTISASVVTCPAFMQIDLRIDGKPVLCHGVLGGKRRIVSGIPLFPFTAANGNFLRILALNSIDWSFTDSGSTSEKMLQSESEMDRSAVTITSSNTIKDAARAPEKNRLWWVALIVLGVLLVDTVFLFSTGRAWGRAK